MAGAVEAVRIGAIQYRRILDELTTPGAPEWWTTRDIADETPWATLTVLQRLLALKRAGRVVSEKRGKLWWWRLVGRRP